MIEFPVTSPDFRCLLPVGGNGEFRIDVSGPGVLLFDANAGPSPKDPDAVTPDPVTFLAARIADGFFPSARGEPVAFVVTDVQTLLPESRQIWTVTTQGLHPGVFKVLVHLLIARQMTRINIAPTGTAVQPVDIAALPYPPELAQPTFLIDHKVPLVAKSGRRVGVEFSAEPDDATLDLAFEILDDWTTLALLGAYPEPGQSAVDSGLVPEIARLDTPRSIEMGVDVAFACDEAAWTSLMTCFLIGKGRDIGLRQISIR